MVHKGPDFSTSLLTVLFYVYLIIAILLGWSDFKLVINPLACISIFWFITSVLVNCLGNCFLHNFSKALPKIFFIVFFVIFKDFSVFFYFIHFLKLVPLFFCDHSCKMFVSISKDLGLGFVNPTHCFLFSISLMSFLGFNISFLLLS